MALTVYCWLLFLYPGSYRDELGEEMTSVFRDARNTLPPALAAKLSFYGREFYGLVWGAVRAHFDRLFGPAIPSWRIYMQPNFRFPRSTVFLMWVILAGVLLTIEKAKTIQVKYGPEEIMAVWNSLPWFLFLFPALACAAVAAVWGLLFALRRTGMHRLGRVQTWPEQQ